MRIGYKLINRETGKTIKTGKMSIKIPAKWAGSKYIYIMKTVSDKTGHSTDDIILDDFYN